MISRREFLRAAGRGAASFAAGTSLFAGRRESAVGGEDPDLATQVGQMIMVGFRGMDAPPGSPVVADLVERRIGGVVLFDYDVPLQSPVRNVESPAQVKALTAALRSAGRIPPFIAIDQEGGRIVRLKEKFGFPPTVSAKALGAADDLAATRRAADGIAATLAEAGVDVNFAPVVDVDLEPLNPVIGGLERSFSGDPATVTRHALEFVRAHRARGVLTSLKHFPGHGSSRGDSHEGFTDVTSSWRREELEPYRAAIREGLCDTVMTAHVFNRNLDPRYPATLSRAAVDGILRRELGFDGVVFSDDMQMKAIAANFGFEEAILLAVEAGVDVLTFANNSVFDPGVAASAAEILTRAVRDGRIPSERIRRSYDRVMALKSRRAR